MNNVALTGYGMLVGYGHGVELAVIDAEARFPVSVRYDHWSPPGTFGRFYNSQLEPFFQLSLYNGALLGGRGAQRF